jgi:hypothetical protein
LQENKVFATQQNPQGGHMQACNLLNSSSVSVTQPNCQNRRHLSVVPKLPDHKESPQDLFDRIYRAPEKHIDATFRGWSKKIKIVFCRGFAAHTIGGIGISYYDDVIKILNADPRFTRNHISIAESMPFQTCEYNAHLLFAHLHRNTKPSDDVVIFSHSHGCNTVAKLITDYPEMVSRIKLWLPTQAAFMGSSLADLSKIPLIGRPIHWICGKMMNFLGGSSEVIEDLSPKVRESFWQTHAATLRERTQHMEILSYTSAIDSWHRMLPGIRLTSMCSNMLFYTGAVLKLQTGERNDGLVPLSSQRFPGRPHIEIPDVDHFGPIGKTPQIDLKWLTLAQFAFAFERLRTYTPVQSLAA